MTAVIIDLAATADAVRAAKATGQDDMAIIAHPICVRVGDRVYDKHSMKSGMLTGFVRLCDFNRQYAVIQSDGCSFTAKVRDLLPVNRSLEYH